jgi:hypothetical protein
MKRVIFLTLLLTGLLAQCISVPIQPEPVPGAPEPVPGAPVGVSGAPKALPGPAQPEEAPQPPPEPKPESYTHEVRWPGETLSHIARWYTGSQVNWRKIARANADLEPLSINIGDRILIPEELLKTRKPMPREYLRSLAAPGRIPKTGSSEPQKDAKGEELFGPVEVLSPQGASEEAELFGPVELLETPARSRPSSGVR